jgi:SPP1 family predicted phage head-tail adaptor
MSILSRASPRRLDTRVRFERKVETQDSATGAITTTWEEHVTVHAAVDATKASERFAAEQELAGTDYTIWIYWRGDLTPNMRAVWNGIPMDIVGIPNNQRRGQFMSIFARAGINEG